MGSEIATQRRITDILEEYDAKKEGLKDVLDHFEAAGSHLMTSSCVSGTFGRTRIDTGKVYLHTLEESLLKSAWWNIYDGLCISQIASAADKQKIERSMESPPEFTLENIRATFGDYILNPRQNILRGLAEVFCSLDQAFKSHEKVKIGAKGLPKRVIISNVNSYGWGYDQLRDVLNALASYQGKPLITYQELQLLLEDEHALMEARTISSPDGKDEKIIARGVRLRRFRNGNAHLFFEPDTLRDVNMALAEYYGNVLADGVEKRPEHQRASTQVSKDLQYYPTPVSVAERVVADINVGGMLVLEPSCGCGRIMESLRHHGAEVHGIEVDPSRVMEAREKGFSVFRGNFLEVSPDPVYDRVVMNPPFYGRHYVKHVEHAMKFLKPGGVLTAILPSTARYDHGWLEGRWSDLPVGSFSESGTNVNTTVLTMRKE